ncbi:MAG: 2-C-methyl-D-erythritol 2,4-cyclodiphosphate synthase [Gammaproteobacteria bacterium]|nr:2-C-methyl-D-erythritol 2,4-cyclodiphosphate synthase [Gammaproteobacteria bacterium]
MRIGHGYDAHRLAEGRALVLGGVSIPYGKGLTAHSDGDVVIHALCDALLGAAGLGDIGRYFPDSEAEFKDIDSRILLRKVVQLLNENDLAVANADIIIVADRPKLSPYFARMRENLAADMAIDVESVNIKASTTEGMGFTGRGEGIASHAIALLSSGSL